MSEWYAEDGLRFGCTRCGHCCTGSPGFVWISPAEVNTISRYLSLAPAKFTKRYARLVNGNLSLVEKPGTTGDCVFLTDDNRCAIQDVKPRQCLIFPFWPRLLVSREKWEQGTAQCPGSGAADAPLFKPEELDAIANRETPRELICRLMAKKPGSG